MEFGRLTEHALKTADITLPADGRENSLILKGQGPNKTKFYMGTPKWGRKEWVGTLYPRGTKDSQFQQEYVKQYNAIEFNPTHYTLYKPEQIAQWTAKYNNSNFRFCPKFWNAISHYSGFNNTASITNDFLQGVTAFGKMLGPLFMQISEKYSPRQRDKVFSYLATLPKDLAFFLEVRHPDWFNDDIIRKELFDTLRTLGIGAVITDTLGRHDVLHMELSVPKAFIRFVCQGDHPSDTTRIDAWATRLNEWQQKGLEECYFFVHTLKEGFSPQLTKYVSETFNKECNANLPEVKLLTMF